MAPLPNRRTVIAVVATALVAATVGVLLYLRAPEAVDPGLRLEIRVAGIPQLMAVSPDGSRLAYAAAGPDGRNALWVRSLSSSDACSAQRGN